MVIIAPIIAPIAKKNATMVPKLVMNSEVPSDCFS